MLRNGEYLFFLFFFFWKWEVFFAVLCLCCSILLIMMDRVFHGDRDDIVPMQESRKMVDALRQAGAEEVTFTRFEELMHDSWTAAYNDLELFKWMFERRRREKGDERVVPEENKVLVEEFF